MTCTCKSPDTYGPKTEVLHIDPQGKVLLSADKDCPDHGYTSTYGPILYPIRKRTWITQGEIAALLQLKNDRRDPVIIEKQSGRGVSQALVEYTDRFTTTPPDGEARAHYEV